MTHSEGDRAATAGEMPVTELRLSEVNLLADMATTAIEEGLLNDLQRRSVEAALDDYGEARISVEHHLEVFGGDVMVMEVPTLAADWLRFAAGLVLPEGCVRAEDVKVGDVIVVDHFTEGVVTRVIDGGSVGLLILVTDDDGDTHELTPIRTQPIEVVEYDQ